VETELRIHDKTIVLQHIQAWKEESVGDGLGIVPSMKPTLFLAIKAISMERGHVLKLSPFSIWETSTTPGLSPWGRKNGLEKFSFENGGDGAEESFMDECSDTISDFDYAEIQQMKKREKKMNFERERESREWNLISLKLRMNY
jgi:hypothetical protein